MCERRQDRTDHRRLRLAAAGLAAAALLGACSSGPSDDGPLVSASSLGGDGEWCLPGFEAGGDISHGSEIVDNTSDQEVEVTGVTLVGSDGFELVDSYQRPAVDPATAGTLSRWPPRKRIVLEPLTTIEPGARTNVVLQLRSTPEATRARIDGVDIAYRADGRDHVTHAAFSVRWTRTCGP